MEAGQRLSSAATLHYPKDKDPESEYRDQADPGGQVMRVRGKV